MFVRVGLRPALCLADCHLSQTNTMNIVSFSYDTCMSNGIEGYQLSMGSKVLIKVDDCCISCCVLG